MYIINNKRVNDEWISDEPTILLVTGIVQIIMIVIKIVAITMIAIVTEIIKVTVLQK